MRQLVLAFMAVVVSSTGQMSFTDPQGNAYTAIKIGEQIWMAENLNYKVADGSYCYSNDPSSCDDLGRLYTWQAAKQAAEEIDGWHLPSKEEWDALLAICGEDSVGFVNITSKKIGFNPLWAGVRVSYGEYKARGKGANYWSSTPSDTSSTLAFSVAVMNNLKIISVHNYPQNNACSVRLVRD
jgi:uncharacterized protein (TIGR02145 family)